MALPLRESIDHRPGRPQHWHDADEDLRRWVGAIVSRLGRLDDVIAVYLHGSLAMGSFFRPKSDVDLLVVVDDALDEVQRRGLAVDLLEHFDQRPIIGGVELSAVRRPSLESFSHPMPYEFHFSEIWAEDVRQGGSGPRGTDRDLAAHCTMTRQRGLALLGPDPITVIGDVPHAAFLDAVMADTRWIIEGGIVESPFYGVLNICRSVQMMLDEPALPPSKDESGRWALANLPAEHHAVVSAALECYRSEAVVPATVRRFHGHRWQEQQLLGIADWARVILRDHL